jgi:hypothetical protein
MELALLEIRRVLADLSSFKAPQETIASTIKFFQYVFFFKEGEGGLVGAFPVEHDELGELWGGRASR